MEPNNSVRSTIQGFASICWLVVMTMALCLFPIEAHAKAKLKRVALIIGNANYKYTDRLKNTEKDARNMAELLRNHGFDAVLEKHNLRLGEFHTTIQEFVEIAADADIVLVYFSGHGIELGQENFLLPIDAKLRQRGAENTDAISLHRLRRRIHGNHKLRVFILDSCRRNPFRDQTALQSFGAAKGLPKETSNILGKPKGRLKNNVVIAYAAGNGTYAYDGNENENSPYTKVLLKYLMTQNRDILKVFGKIGEEVEKATNGLQSPDLYARLGGDDFVLAPKFEVKQVLKSIEDASKIKEVEILLSVHGGKDRKIEQAGQQRMAALRNKFDLSQWGKALRSSAKTMNPFQDCEACPQMIRVPTSVGKKQLRLPGLPKLLAFGQYEVTNEQWAKCAVEGVCRKTRRSTAKNLKKYGKYPVTSINWYDVHDYINWLNKKTHRTSSKRPHYRLPTEAEWEYAALAGTKAQRYWWGNRAARKYANYGTKICCGSKILGPDRWSQEAPVGQFEPNPYKLYDMNGNVREWLSNCAHRDCRKRSVRGGSWYDAPKKLSSKYRASASPTSRENDQGFRLVLSNE